MMKIYSLTPLGEAVAKSTRFPNTNEWKVIHHLARVNHATPEQIVTYCGMSQGEASAALQKLRIKKIVTEETGVEV